MRIRANENHPLFQKVAELFAKMEELGIIIERRHGTTYHVIDKKTGEDWELLDLEDYRQCGLAFDSLPPGLEWKLRREGLLTRPQVVDNAVGRKENQ